MKVEAYLTRTRNGYIVTKDPTETGERHYAIWRTATVRNWWKIQRDEDLASQERLAWEVLLEETSLFKEIKDLWTFRPAILPRFLVNEMLQTTVLTITEANQIERESMQLWGSSKPRYGQKYHPLLEKVSNAMVFAEKLQLKVFPEIDDMDVKTYQGVLHTLNCYGNVLSLNETQRRLRQQAVQQAGVQAYTGKR